MRAILTRAREDGTFPEVGTTGRTVTRTGQYKTEAGIRRLARGFGNGLPVRVEFFHGDSIYGEAYKVEVVR